MITLIIQIFTLSCSIVKLILENFLKDIYSHWTCKHCSKRTFKLWNCSCWEAAKKKGCSGKMRVFFSAEFPFCCISVLCVVIQGWIIIKSILNILYIDGQDMIVYIPNHRPSPLSLDATQTRTFRFHPQSTSQCSKFKSIKTKKGTVFIGLLSYVLDRGTSLITKTNHISLCSSCEHHVCYCNLAGIFGMTTACLLCCRATVSWNGLSCSHQIKLWVNQMGQI